VGGKEFETICDLPQSYLVGTMHIGSQKRTQFPKQQKKREMPTFLCIKIIGGLWYTKNCKFSNKLSGF
jgi:hypothetical protein